MSPVRLARRALLLTMVASVVAEAAPPTRFKFKIPTGWTDLLDNPSEDVVATLHPVLAVQMLRDDQLALGADLNPGSTGKNSFMQAFKLPGGLEVNEATLPEIREQIVQSSKDNEVKITIKSAEIVSIGGADAARLTWEVKSDEGDEMRMAYVIPGGPDEAALLIYAASADDFLKVRPLMEASAQATEGAVPSPRATRLFYRALPVLQIIGVVGVIALLLGSRKKQPIMTPVKAPPPPRPADDEDDEDDEDEPAAKKPAGEKKDDAASAGQDDKPGA